MRMAMGIALLAMAACGQKASDPQRVDDILALDGDPVAGEVVYGDNCSGCHGANGEGGSGPTMSSVAKNSEAGIINVVLSGEESMPSFDTLPDQDIADVVAYIVETY